MFALWAIVLPLTAMAIALYLVRLWPLRGQPPKGGPGREPPRDIKGIDEQS